MKLQSFGISNFKAFGPKPQQIPLKPITLVFGANSSGKSSLLHGILWSLESVARGHFEVRSSIRVLGNLDLGGFHAVRRGHSSESKIKIEFGCGNHPSGESIVVSYEVGNLSERDIDAEHERRLNEDPEIREFIACRVITKEVAETFRLLSHQSITTDAEIEEVVKSAEAWQRFLEPYNAKLDELQTEEPEHDWDKDREKRTAEEMHSLFLRGKKAWSRMRELGGKEMVARIMVIYDQLQKDKAIEGERVSLVSLEVRIGGRRAFHAERALATDVLIANPRLLLPELWEFVAPDFAYSMATRTRPGFGGLPVDTPFAELRCEIPRLLGESDEARAGLRERVLPWLQNHWKDLKETAASLIYIGPLRALPHRHDLTGRPGDSSRDALLAPWHRIRDDVATRNAVNAALKLLTKSPISFRQVVYGLVQRTLEAENEFPGDRRQRDSLGRKPKPFDWEEPGLMEGYVEIPEEFLPDTPGPFYDDIKFDDPDYARSMVEAHLIDNYPDDVLLDLKVTTGSGAEVTLQDVGVGISQIAPVLVQAFGNEGKLIAIEQPEIHIHPALQAELGDVFIESALGENKNTFLLETHSEHLILRLLRRIRETTRGKLPEGKLPITPADIAVLYVEPGEEGSVVRELRVNDQGRFIDNWPNGFFEERFNEEF